MAEHDDEREVARRYRQLPRDEPPPQLDAAIRSEARVRRSAPRRWYLPVAAAAVVVLAVAVTVLIDPKQADPLVASAPSEAMKSENKEITTFAAASAPEAPAHWLERIARLRSEGRHEQADEALAEFRKRYPDFRISPEMLEKVEKK
jgi:predicted TIM-barrel fold metal-dependent hydrolase